MTTNDNSIDSKVKDQNDKLNLLIQHLLPHCHVESEHEDFRKIGQVLLAQKQQKIGATLYPVLY